MLNRTNKLTALLTAAAAVASLTPVVAAEKLGTKEGTITNAIAFDGTFVFDGYRTDDDDSGLYFNNGKDKMVDEDEDYTYDELVKYGKKYALVQDGDENFLVDLSTGKIIDDESVEDKEINATTKLRTNLKKADRYEYTKDKGVDPEIEKILDNKFGDVWYKYSALGDATTDTAISVGSEKDGDKYIVAYHGFVNESGKYIDISHTANLYVYNDNGKTVKVTEYDKDKDGIRVFFKDATAIAQDEDYIYTITKVVVSGTTETEQMFLQKISKAQGEKKDGAYLPKSVTSYQIDKTIFKDDDMKDAYDVLTDNVSDNYEVKNIEVKNSMMYVTTVKDDSVKMFNLKLKKDKVDTADGKKNVDAYVVMKDNDADQDTIEASSNNAENTNWSIDAEGNTWALDKGKIYKYDGSDFKLVYTCDRSMDQLDVYNEKNLIAWDSNGDVFTTVSEGKAATEGENTEEDKKEEETVVKAGWDKNSDGTWSYYKDGAKATGWVLDGSWYYLDANGIMKTGWLNDRGTWYYLNASGAMQTGWLNDNGTWYYLNASGAMLSNQWFQDTDGRWYFLQANGAMATNTVIDGYRVGANGAWIR